MRTITTREQLLVNGKVRERIATHIVTGAHGYETLCTSGYNLQYNKERVLIENCEKVADGELPVTCHTCFSVWQDVHRFKPDDVTNGAIVIHTQRLKSDPGGNLLS